MVVSRGTIRILDADKIILVFTRRFVVNVIIKLSKC